jgi:hypothetical protein
MFIDKHRCVIRAVTLHNTNDGAYKAYRFSLIFNKETGQYSYSRAWGKIGNMSRMKLSNDSTHFIAAVVFLTAIINAKIKEGYETITDELFLSDTMSQEAADYIRAEQFKPSFRIMPTFIYSDEQQVNTPAKQAVPRLPYEVWKRDILPGLAVKVEQQLCS